MELNILKGAQYKQDLKVKILDEEAPLFDRRAIHHFRQTTVAYRNDFCLYCGRPRLTYCIKSFDVFIIFPMGTRRHWRCTVCKQNPHSHLPKAKIRMWYTALTLGIFTAAMWISPYRYIKWVFAPIFTVMFLHAFWSIARARVRSPRKFNLQEKLRLIQPAREKVCPLCGVSLITDDIWRCPSCGIEREVIPV